MHSTMCIHDNFRPLKIHSILIVSIIESSLDVDQNFLKRKQLIMNFWNIPDIDECTTTKMAYKHNCHQNASCSNTHGSFVCTCVSVYTGDGKNCTGIIIINYYIHTFCLSIPTGELPSRISSLFCSLSMGKKSVFCKNLHWILTGKIIEVFGIWR